MAPSDESHETALDSEKIAELEAKLRHAECEINALKAQLQSTQAELHKTRDVLAQQVVAATWQSITPASTVSFAAPSQQSVFSSSAKTHPSSEAPRPQKRARSPSLEILVRPRKVFQAENTAEGRSSKGPSTKVHGTRKSIETEESVEQGPSREQSAMVPADLQRDVSASSSTSLPSVSSLSSISNTLDHSRNSELTPTKPTVYPSRDSTSEARSTPGVNLALKPKSSPQSLKTDPSKKEMKAKQEVLKFQEVFDDYLESAAALNISPGPLQVPITRAFLRLTYGGSDQQFLQIIQPENNPSGMRKRRMVFPTLHMNPLMSSKPGEPGLLFASRHEILSNPPWTLWCKQGTEAVWLYLGEYESEKCGTMTPEQFQMQKPMVQKQWVDLLQKHKQFDVYVAMRARIGLRKMGKLPCDPSQDPGELEKKEMAAIRAGKGVKLDNDDIKHALEVGDEAIDILRMVCVSYDHTFADDLKAKWRSFDRSKSKKSPKSTKPESKTTKRKGKGKATLVEDSHLDSDGSEMVVDTARSTSEANRRPQRTRTSTWKAGLYHEESADDDEEDSSSELDMY